ncbi:hypothetical protein [Marinilactibacillus psychrotolerans]|uniref:hypothetical protein n=1 Tax=Marinilactibacillus psychrotolerans TaxID=191770 RepID=UPI0038868D31
MSNQINNGYWAVATQKHLCKFQTNSPNYEEFDALNVSGKAGRLLGLIRGNTQITDIKRMEKLAGTMGIGKRELKKTIFPELERVTDKKIELHKNSSGEIIGLEEYFLSTEEVLSAAGDYFEYMEPDDTERITVETLSNTKKIPNSGSELHSILAKEYSEETIKHSLVYQEQFRLIKKSTINNDEMYSNEYVWNGKQDKIIHSLQKLDIVSREELSTFIELLQKTQGTSQSQIGLNEQLLLLAKKTGIIDPINIKTSRSFNQEFLFTSNFLGGETLTNDILDDVKLLISSIRFGTKFTQYSRLSNPILFLERLVAGGKVGPHSANGTDYILLESRGIIKTTPSIHRPGRFYMELLKKDIGNKALEILKSSNYDIESSVDRYNFSDPQDKHVYFESPENSRMNLAESTAAISEAEDYFIQVLRGEGL